MFNRSQRPPSDAERNAQMLAARQELAADPNAMFAEREAYEPEQAVPLEQPLLGLSTELDQPTKKVTVKAISPEDLPDDEPILSKEMTEGGLVTFIQGDSIPVESLNLNRLLGISGLWTLGNEPPEDAVYIVMGRYPQASRGHPRVATYIGGAWFETSRNKPEPIVVWAWMPRDVLGEWPQEPA